MNKIQKPEWLLYAEKVRVQVDNMKPTKSGKREADKIYSSWLDAKDRYGYEGSSRDWEYLIRRLGRVRRYP